MATNSKKRNHPKGPQTYQPSELREFLGSDGFCRLRILVFDELAQPLYEVTRGGKSPLDWTPQMKKPVMKSGQFY